MLLSLAVGYLAAFASQVATSTLPLVTFASLETRAIKCLPIEPSV